MTAYAGWRLDFCSSGDGAARGASFWSWTTGCRADPNCRGLTANARLAGSACTSSPALATSIPATTLSI
jgi:hypothetical protein